MTCLYISRVLLPYEAVIHVLITQLPPDNDSIAKNILRSDLACLVHILLLLSDAAGWIML